jgi:DNA processing protein
MKIDENRRYEIALSLIPGLSISNIQTLLGLTGSAKAVFSDKHLSLIENLDLGTKHIILKRNTLHKADEEIEKCIRFDLSINFINDADFPKRLLECSDAPAIIYSKGHSDFNAKKIVSVVGTRKATPNGIKYTENLVKDLAFNFPEIIIVSGLAYGIDICAHKSALENGINTIAVLAHGFQEIYPSEHRNSAIKIIESGSLLTEFQHGTPPLPYQFLQRNRIIAGLSDACIVVESGIKGGSMKTADYALSYNREVFAYPGRPSDVWSKGCNSLIKSNKAALSESAEDIIKGLNWDICSKKPEQKTLFPEITVNQEILYNLMHEGELISIPDLIEKSGMPISGVLSDMMQMEITGLVKSYPGGQYIKNISN